MTISFLVVNRRQIIDRRMAAVRVVPPFDEVEYRHARRGLGFEAGAIKELALEGGKETLAQTLSKQSPTEPIEGRTPA